jgi:serine/threonine protein kinase
MNWLLKRKNSTWDINSCHQGNNLANIIQVRQFLPETEALGYIQQIGQALIEVHKLRVIFLN